MVVQECVLGGVDGRLVRLLAQYRTTMHVGQQRVCEELILVQDCKCGAVLGVHVCTQVVPFGGVMFMYVREVAEAKLVRVDAVHVAMPVQIRVLSVVREARRAQHGAKRPLQGNEVRRAKDSTVKLFHKKNMRRAQHSTMRELVQVVDVGCVMCSMRRLVQLSASTAVIVTRPSLAAYRAQRAAPAARRTVL